MSLVDLTLLVVFCMALFLGGVIALFHLRKQLISSDTNAENLTLAFLHSHVQVLFPVVDDLLVVVATRPPGPPPMFGGGGGVWPPGPPPMLGGGGGVEWSPIETLAIPKRITRNRKS